MRKITFLFLCLMLASSQLWAQNRTITGKVTDDKGNAVPNASVVVKGSTAGTSTDADGSFSLSIPSSAKTIVVSSINYSIKEIKVAGKDVFSIALTSSATDLSEIVVQVPYGTVKKTAFTGSEATVTAKAISKQQVTSVTRVLEGLVPGILTTNGGGEPGTGASVVIRGIGSYSSKITPLYVLNGIPYNGSIAAISTDEIESVTILKDAAAASLYGSRASNGVIMITTKKGKKGKASVSATVRQGFMNRGIPEYDKVGAKDYYELMWEASRNANAAAGGSFAAAGIKASQELTDGNHLVYNAYNVPGNQLVDPVTGKLNSNASLLWNESWEDVLYQTAQRTNANVNISGASDKSDYFLSFGYLNEEGTVKFSGYKRYNLRLSANTAATDWLNAGINIDGAVADRNGLLQAGTFTSNPFYYTRAMGPIYPVYQHDLTTGAVVTDPITGQALLDWGVPSQMGTRPYAGNSNLLGSLALDKRNTKIFNGNANSFLEAKFLKDFSFKTSLGINYITNYGTVYQNSLYGDAQNVRGRSTKTSDRQLSLTLNEVLNWSRDFGKHSLSALVGHENYKVESDVLSSTRSGFQFVGQSELDNGEVTETASSSGDNNRIESYFSGVNYDYDNKYLLSGSIRTDGSSRFAKDVRWGQFYSFGAGWRLSQENFMKNANWINELKFKLSYGESGNEDITSLYPYRTYYDADGTGGYTPPTSPGNPIIKWEGNKIFNVGFDFAFFKNRLQGTIEYFNRVSDDLIFDVPLPPSTGNITVLQNIGTLKNTGIELQLGYNVIRKRNFDWRVDLNLTHFDNKITKLPPKQPEIVNGSKKLMVGKSLYDFWLKEFAGVDAATGDALYYKDVLGADGKPTGDRVLTNKYSAASFYYRGSAIPDISGGLTNSFRYKNFDLSFLLTFSYGGKFLDYNYASLTHSGDYGTAWSTDILKRWQKPGDITNVPRLQNGVSDQGDGAASTRYLMDGSYLNIKNVTLSYSLPNSLASRLHIGSLQVFGNVDNAYLFTAKKGSDPQRSFTGTADFTYTPFRTVSFGLNVTL